MLGEYHRSAPDLLQHLAVDVALGLADDPLDPNLLQIKRDKGGVSDIVSHRHHGAVVVAHAQGPQNRGVPGVAGDGVGDLATLCT